MDSKEKQVRIIELAPQTVDLFARCLSHLRPPPTLTLSKWADTYRMLSAENSAAPGRWHTDNAPYQREIMDAIGDPHIRKVVIMSAAQIGKTAMLMNMLGYYMHYYPAPVLVMQPTLDLGQTFSKDFLAPMIRDTPVLRVLVDTKSRYSGNTILKKNFPGGYVAIVGANSPVGLRSRPVKVLLADEVDAYPESAGTEGDPLLLAQKRQTVFWDKKTVIVSTPTIYTAPLLLGKSGYDALYNVLSVGCGVTCSWYQEDGQVKFGPAEEGWRDYVTKMHDWYKKGLIDPDFMASTAPVMFVPDTAMVTTGKTGAFMGIYTNVAMWEAAIEGDEDNFVPVYAPMQKAGDTHDFHGVLLSTATATGGLSISAKSEYAVECLKLFDYWFTEEGTTFCNYGIEDDTFKIDDSGKPSFTETVTANADGLSFAQAMAYFTFPPARPVHQDWTRELAAVPEKDLVSFRRMGQGHEK